MAVLTFPRDVRYDPAGTFQVDTKDILAVRNNGASSLTQNRTEFHRIAYMHDGQKIAINVVSAQSSPPDNIKALDDIGGKPTICVGTTGYYGASDRMTLNGFFSNALRISTSPSDLNKISVDSTHASKVCETTIGGIFADDGRSRTVPHGTPIHHALFNIAGQNVPVAHLNRDKFKSFSLAQ